MNVSELRTILNNLSPHLDARPVVVASHFEMDDVPSVVEGQVESLAVVDHERLLLSVDA